ncbi:family 16 glycosylhydrolase [Kitasatospora azatica]|uniref:family 16 glycosylhydrolase n=1 Tax=Kitasatospora azatica TaxID=58347 RepID=UPI00056A0D32|nr:family 16 glycosylhydrolase [Kitasatospora azatica]
MRNPLPPTGRWPLPGSPLTLALALSGWLALAATALPGAVTPLRVAIATAFVLVCPGGAAVRAADVLLAARGQRMEALEAGVLTVALSLSCAALTAEGLYLTRGFSTVRALAALATVTTLLTLFTGWLGRRADRGGAASPSPVAGKPGSAKPDSRTGRGRHARTAAALAAAGLLAFTAACGSAGGKGPGSPAGAAGGGSRNSAGPSAPAAPGPWHLVMQDDFLGSTLNSADWTTCYDWNDGGCTNSGNNELEWYLPGQVKLADGALNLTAQRENTKGTDGHQYSWRSGMVSTGRDSWNATPRHTFTHGYFAAAVRVPAAGGMFPAFWLMPDTRSVPPEIDAAEFIGTTQSVELTLHWPAPDGSDQIEQGSYGPQDFAAGYHVFAVDWESDAVTWYVDGVQRFKVTDPAKIPTGAMEVLLNLAVGFPSPPPESVNSATMQVDWVRIWQH